MFNPHLLRIVVITLIAVILNTRTVVAQELSPEGILNKNRAAIYTLVDKHRKKDNILGFGFAINSEGLVLTNAHVIGTNNFVVVGPKNKIYEVDKLVFKDSKRDLVLFQLHNAEDIQTVELGDSKDLNIGNRVVTLVDYNKGDLTPKNTIVGKMVNIPTKDLNIILLETTLKIPALMEGSPLFDKKGKVVGILFSANDDSEIIGTAGIAINDLHRYKNHIRSFLKDSGEPIKVSKVKFKEKVEEEKSSDKKTEENENESVAVVKSKTTVKITTPKEHKKKNSSKKTDVTKQEAVTDKKTSEEEVKPETKKKKRTLFEKFFRLNRPKKEARKAEKDEEQKVKQSKTKSNQDKKSEEKKVSTKKTSEEKSKKQVNKKVPQKNVEKTKEAEAKPEKKKKRGFLARVFRLNKSEKKPRKAEKEEKDLVATASPPHSSGAKNSTVKKVPGVDLTGYWFDINTGLNLYLEQNGNTITMKNANSSLLQTKTESSKGLFKKQGDIFVGQIESTIVCSNNYHAKANGDNSCNLKEPAEIVSWNNDKIDLRVNTIDDYNCRMCLNPSGTSWKNRILLRKVFKE